MRQCILTEEDANKILAILTELPYKYGLVIHQVKDLLESKFIEYESITESTQCQDTQETKYSAKD